MGLFEWGIKKIAQADANIQTFGRTFGMVPLSWWDQAPNDTIRNALMWRIPDPSIQMPAFFANRLAIKVDDRTQMAIILRDGAMDERVVIDQGGIYEIERPRALFGNISVIWFSTRELKLRWGLSAMTSDNISFGAGGYYNAVISDPEEFLTLAGNARVFSENQLLERAREDVSATIQDVLIDKNAEELYRSRQECQIACQEHLTPIFRRWGLEFRNLTMNINFPEHVVKALEREKLTIWENKGKMQELDFATQQQQVQIALEAQRIQLLGNAQVDVMRNQLGIGLNPLEIQRIEAIKILAEHPSEGTLTDNRPQIVSQLMPQTPAVPPMFVAPVLPMQQPAPTPDALPALPANASSTSSTIAGETMTREKIEEMLDKLDERFANGEISEQVYLTMQDKWQKRLEKLS